MIRKVTKELITWADLPAKFEGGTPAIGEAVGFGAAVRWMDELGLPAVHAAEAELTAVRARADSRRSPDLTRLRAARRATFAINSSASSLARFRFATSCAWRCAAPSSPRPPG